MMTSQFDTCASAFCYAELGRTQCVCGTLRHLLALLRVQRSVQACQHSFQSGACAQFFLHVKQQRCCTESVRVPSMLHVS